MNVGRVPTVSGKTRPPAFPQAIVQRDRLRVSDSARVQLIIAPAGYGKTVAACQLVGSDYTTTAWLSLDLLDDDRSFWMYFIQALRSLVAVDDEPELMLHEQGPDTPGFIAALANQIEAIGQPARLVLDGIGNITSATVFNGMAALVDRVGHLLTLVLTGRADPPLPIARWRSMGWVTELRENTLRLNDAEALELAQLLSGVELTSDAVLAINHWVDGWPIGMHLALMSLEGVVDADAEAHAMTSSGRMLTDYLVAEVLERLSPEERDVAMAISVVEWFDPELCRDLVGGHAAPVLHHLHRRGMFLTVLDSHSGAMRFHSLVRELLESELLWRDPGRRTDLHRRAAGLWRARGELNLTYRHLMAVNDVIGVHEILVKPALDMVNRGDLAALRRLVRTLPQRGEVSSPLLAIDLATVAFFAGDRRAATQWREHAGELLDPDDVPNRVRLLEASALQSLMNADLEAAERFIRIRGELHPPTAGVSPFDQRFPTVGTRVALGRGQLDEARDWLGLAKEITEPEIVVNVTVPALEAWLHWQLGNLEQSISAVEPALAWVNEHKVSRHHGAFETLITAGWCRLGAGRLDEAELLAQRAQADAVALGMPWNFSQSGLLRSQVALLTGDPRTALQVIVETQTGFEPVGRHALTARFAGIEALALAQLGRLDEALTVIDGLADSARTRLLRARIAPLDINELTALLTDHPLWTTFESLLAQVVLATHAPLNEGANRLRKVVEGAADSGWVLPFLGHGDAVTELLRQLPLEQIHPALNRAVRRTIAAQADQPVPRLGEPLTAREQTLLELLPTHLSYAQIGGRLYLSVNTVKTNLKSVYRKLSVSSRSEAVEYARRTGLLPD